MRLKTEIWIKAYIRRCATAGIPAVVVRHGDDDAGAIYIRINRLDGRSDLYGPAPAGSWGAESERRFTPCLKERTAADSAVEDYLERACRTDPDLWVVEIEARDGKHCLDGWIA